jgi:endonuclease/exonuclease/phosphatase (EEP) superfamily protein YafD
MAVSAAMGLTQKMALGAGRMATRFATLGGALCLSASLLGLFGHYSWLCDGFSHFRWQYFFGLAVCAAIVAIAHRWQFVIAFAAAAVLNFALIVGVVMDTPPPRTPVQGTGLKLLIVNLHDENPAPERLLDVVESFQPDVVGVLEFTPAAQRALAPLIKGYPTSEQLPEGAAFGIAIWTRVPDAKVSVLKHRGSDVSSLQLDFSDKVGAAQLVLTHPFPPVGERLSGLRDAQLLEIARIVRAHPESGIVAGDLNLTPWSAGYRALRENSQLYDSLSGRWPAPTWWPAPGVWRVFGVPIDQVLIGAGWRCVEREIGPDVGSDHRPLLVSIERIQ